VTLSYGSLIFKMEKVLIYIKFRSQSKYGQLSERAPRVHFLVTVCINICLIVTSFFVNPFVIEQGFSATDEFGQPTVIFDFCTPKDASLAYIYGFVILYHIVFYIYGLYFI